MLRRQLLIPLLVRRVACLSRNSNNVSRFWAFEAPHPEGITTINRSMLHSTAPIERNIDKSFRFATLERVDPDAGHHDFRIPTLLFELSEGTTRTRPGSRPSLRSVWSQQPLSRTRIRQVTPLRQSRNCSSKLRSVKSECLEGPVVKYPGSGPPRYSARKEPLRPNRTLVCRVVRVDGSCNKPTGFCFVV